MSDELPEGWVATRLEDVLEPGGLFDGPFGSSLKTSDYTDVGVRVIRLENLANLKFIEDKRTFISPAKYNTLLKHTVLAGDILVGSFVDGAVRVCLLPELATKAIAKADCFTVRTRRDVADRQFVAFQLGSSATRDTFVGDIHGATRPRITTRQLRECDLTVAPFPEQHRIVDKVKALLEQVNRARGRLDRVPVILKRFRQAVLAAACSGELTREWRVEHDEPEEAWPGTPPSETPGWLPQFPLSWSVRYLEDISERVSVGHVGPTTEFYCSPHIGVPFVRSQNVRPSRLVLDEVQHITRAFHDSLRKSQLQPGDLLVVRVGANRGDSCVVPDGLGDVNCANIVFARPISGASQWTGLYANSPDGQKQLQEMTTGSAQGVLNTGAVARLVVPLPTSGERKEIAHRVASLFTLADTIERRVQAAAARAEKLPQAILSKAFAGELVPTEAELARAEGRTYETAEEMLARVSAGVAPGTSSKRRRSRG